jgi:hypothetical protein
MIDANKPTAKEQELLELINRFRANPELELAKLLNSKDPYVQFAFDYYQVNRDTLAKQWKNLKSVAPLAWSDNLAAAAEKHNAAMIAADLQSHQLPNEASIKERAIASGYNPIFYGENVYGSSKSIEFTHVGFAIDWGKGADAIDGIQNPAGHRQTMMSDLVREVGIAVTQEENERTSIGPYVVTQDFGTRSELIGKGWLLGVAYDDRNRDGNYQAEEGLEDIQVKIMAANGGDFSQTIDVNGAGGYQALLAPGAYQVEFLQNNRVVQSQRAVIDGNLPENVKVDLVLSVDVLGDDLQVSNIQGSLLDFRTDNTPAKASLTGSKIAIEFVNVSRDASYQNNVGFYRIEDPYGLVVDPLDGKSYQPGDAGYTLAALRRSLNSNDGLRLDRDGQNDRSHQLQGGYIYAPFIIADGTIDDVLNTDRSLPTPQVYFNYHAANTDRRQHIQTLAPNKFSFEDTLGGGDLDFNDLIFQVRASAQNS